MTAPEMWGTQQTFLSNGLSAEDTLVLFQKHLTDCNFNQTTLCQPALCVYVWVRDLGIGGCLSFVKTHTCPYITISQSISSWLRDEPENQSLYACNSLCCTVSWCNSVVCLCYLMYLECKDVPHREDSWRVWGLIGQLSYKETTISSR